MKLRQVTRSIQLGRIDEPIDNTPVPITSQLRRVWHLLQLLHLTGPVKRARHNRDSTVTRTCLKNFGLRESLQVFNFFLSFIVCCYLLCFSLDITLLNFNQFLCYVCNNFWFWTGFFHSFTLVPGWSLLQRQLYFHLYDGMQFFFGYSNPELVWSLTRLFKVYQVLAVDTLLSKQLCVPMGFFLGWIMKKDKLWEKNVMKLYSPKSF